MPALSPGKSTPVALAEPEAVDPAMRARPPPSFSAIVIVPTLDDSARICRTVIVLGAADVRLVDRRGRRPGSSARAVNDVSGEHDAVLERCGDRHDLEGRAGLVDVGDRAVASRRRPARSRTGSRRRSARSPSPGSPRCFGPSRSPSRPSRPTACTLRTSSCSAVAWIWWSRVRITFLPGSLGARADDVDRRGRSGRGSRPRSPLCLRAAGRATARALRDRCCPSPRSRRHGRPPPPAGTSAAPRGRTRALRARASAGIAAWIGSALRLM